MAVISNGLTFTLPEGNINLFTGPGPSSSQSYPVTHSVPLLPRHLTATMESPNTASSPGDPSTSSSMSVNGGGHGQSNKSGRSKRPPKRKARDEDDEDEEDGADDGDANDGSGRSPQWSRQARACLGCRKQKMRCIENVVGQPCQRCKAVSREVRPTPLLQQVAHFNLSVAHIVHFRTQQPWAQVETEA
jgi:hypothetical protein